MFTEFDFGRLTVQRNRQKEVMRCQLALNVRVSIEHRTLNPGGMSSSIDGHVSECWALGWNVGCGDSGPRLHAGLI
jgi:hypothetical protein